MGVNQTAFTPGSFHGEGIQNALTVKAVHILF